MAEPENLVLHRLRELRADMDQRFNATWAEIELIKKKLDSQGQAIIGESVLGRYTVAEVEEQLEALRVRLAQIEAQSGPRR